MADLKVRAAHVGEHRTCPRCQFKLRVPTAEEAARLAARREAPGEYDFSDPDAPPAEAQPYVSLHCHVCMTRMDAPLDQVGHEIVCPDCGTVAIVPPPLPPREQAAPIVPASGEEYAICEGVDQPDTTHKLVYQAYTHFPCPRCGTRMLAPVDQVGQEVVCPDCQVPTIVPTPSEALPAPDAAKVRTKRGEEYSLEPADDEPGRSGVPPDQGQPGRPTYVKVVCPHCHTRLPATSEQVGTQIVCPDCGTTTMVPEPKSPSSTAVAETERAEEYAIGNAIVTPEYRYVTDYRRLEKEPSRTGEAGAGEVDDQPAVPVPPARPPEDSPADEASPAAPIAGADVSLRTFSAGVFRFLLYPGVWQRWVGLSAGAVAVLLLLTPGIALALALRPGSGWGGAPGAVGAMALISVAGVLALVWFAPAAAIWLMVIEETSEGNERIEEWPEAMYTDWMFSAFFVFNSLGAATFFGVMLRGVLRKYAGIVFPPAMPLGIVVFFPLLLLSMMESGSALNPVSWPVWRSMRTAWRAWLAFYLASGLVAATGAAVAAGAIRVVGLWGVTAVAPVLVCLTLIYARLLGRLGRVAKLVAAEEAKKEQTDDEP